MLKSSSEALYSVCNRSWAETQERVYKFDEAVSEEVICCFLNFLYHGRYFAGAISPTESSGSSDGTAEPLHPLLLHAQVCVFADTYLMPSLKGTSTGSIKGHLQGMKDLNTTEKREAVLNLIEYCFDNLQEDDSLLRFLAEYTSFKLSELRLSSQRFEALLLGSDGKFIKNLLPRLSGSSSNPFETPRNTYSSATTSASGFSAAPRTSNSYGGFGGGGGVSSQSSGFGMGQPRTGSLFLPANTSPSFSSATSPSNLFGGLSGGSGTGQPN